MKNNWSSFLKGFASVLNIMPPPRKLKPPVILTNEEAWKLDCEAIASDWSAVMNDLGMKFEEVKCPLCFGNIYHDKLRRYETLTEHVLSPNVWINEEPPLRDTYKCNNMDCYAGRFGYWDIEGSFYVDRELPLDVRKQALYEKMSKNIPDLTLKGVFG